MPSCGKKRRRRKRGRTSRLGCRLFKSLSICLVHSAAFTVQKKNRRKLSWWEYEQQLQYVVMIYRHPHFIIPLNPLCCSSEKCCSIRGLFGDDVTCFDIPADPYVETPQAPIRTLQRPQMISRILTFFFLPRQFLDSKLMKSRMTSSTVFQESLSRNNMVPKRLIMRIAAYRTEVMMISVNSTQTFLS